MVLPRNLANYPYAISVTPSNLEHCTLSRLLCPPTVTIVAQCTNTSSDIIQADIFFLAMYQKLAETNHKVPILYFYVRKTCQNDSPGGRGKKRFALL